MNKKLLTIDLSELQGFSSVARAHCSGWPSRLRVQKQLAKRRDLIHVVQKSEGVFPSLGKSQLSILQQSSRLPFWKVVPSTRNEKLTCRCYDL